MRSFRVGRRPVREWRVDNLAAALSGLPQGFFLVRQTWLANDFGSGVRTHLLLSAPTGSFTLAAKQVVWHAHPEPHVLLLLE